MHSAGTQPTADDKVVLGNLTGDPVEDPDGGADTAAAGGRVLEDGLAAPPQSEGLDKMRCGPAFNTARWIAPQPTSQQTQESLPVLAF